MIAVLSSTLVPSSIPLHDGPRTSLTPEVRLEQTIGSVKSLVSLGVQRIVIADSSPVALPQRMVDSLLPASVVQFRQYPYRNKGIAECRLLLEACPTLPDGVPILKLSARYLASLNLCAHLDGHDLVGRVDAGPWSGGQLSTRGYAVRDVSFLIEFLTGTLDEVYASPWRIVGPRSAVRTLWQLMRPASCVAPLHDPPFGVEHGALRWLRRRGASVRLLQRIGVRGVMGGSGSAIDE